MPKVWKWGQEFRFLILLITILLLMVVYPLLQDTLFERLVFYLLRMIVLVAALWIIYSTRKFRTIGLVFAFPVIMGFSGGYFFSEVEYPSLAILVHFLAALFFMLTIIAILRIVYRQPTITGDGICGALCGYLLIGLIGSQIFTLIELITPGSFQMGNQPIRMGSFDSKTHFLLTYFSFITLATVGYGDLVPINQFARSVAMIEAILGQFYIAVLIGELIGKRVSQSLSPSSNQETSLTPQRRESDP